MNREALLSLPPISNKRACAVTASVPTASSYLSVHQHEYTSADTPSKYCILNHTPTVPVI